MLSTLPGLPHDKCIANSCTVHKASVHPVMISHSNQQSHGFTVTSCRRCKRGRCHRRRRWLSGSGPPPLLSDPDSRRSPSSTGRTMDSWLCTLDLLAIKPNLGIGHRMRSYIAAKSWLKYSVWLWTTCGQCSMALARVVVHWCFLKAPKLPQIITMTKSEVLSAGDEKLCVLHRAITNKAESVPFIFTIVFSSLPPFGKKL